MARCALILMLCWLSAGAEELDIQEGRSRHVKESSLLVTHASSQFDRSSSAKPGIDRVVEKSKAGGEPVFFLVSPPDPQRTPEGRWYTQDKKPAGAYFSSMGEHCLLLDGKTTTVVGGYFHACHLETISQSLKNMSTQSPTIRIYMDAVFTTALKHDFDFRKNFTERELVSGSHAQGWPFTPEVISLAQFKKDIEKRIALSRTPEEKKRIADWFSRFLMEGTLREWDRTKYRAVGSLEAEAIGSMGNGPRTVTVEFITSSR